MNHKTTHSDQLGTNSYNQFDVTISNMMPYFNDDIVYNLTILTPLSTVIKRKTNKNVDSDDIIHRITIWTSISTYTKYGQL